MFPPVNEGEEKKEPTIDIMNKFEKNPKLKEVTNDDKIKLVAAMRLCKKLNRSIN